jgi:hypothetical protein
MSRRSQWLSGGLVAFAALLLWAAPATAQVDIVGTWQQPGNGVVIRGGQFEDMWERCCGGGAGRGGPAAADYSAIPLNEAGRARAMAHEDSLWSVPEHQCQPHAAAYSYWGPGAPQIEAVYNDQQQLVAYHIQGTFRRLPRDIWMDGRPHPPDYERHTWAGFTTGEWKGNTLVARTTHLKKGWVRRNGAPVSDQATLLTYYARHGDILTITVFVDDPLYFTEPYVKSTDYTLAPTVPTASFENTVRLSSEASSADDPYFRCYGTEEVIFPEDHFVPHWLPGTNPSLGDKAAKMFVPVEATLGNAETMYPEYIDVIRKWRAEHAAEKDKKMPTANVPTQGRRPGDQ